MERSPKQPIQKRPVYPIGKKKETSPGPKLRIQPVKQGNAPKSNADHISPLLKPSRPLDPEVPLTISIKSGSFSQVGMSPDNPKKSNQDSSFSIENFLGLDYCHLFGVCDGHGHSGGEVSSFIKDRLPLLLSKSQIFLENPRQAILNSIADLQREILRKSFDTTFSGSTLNLVLILRNKLYCANVGDSRAVLARKEPRRWAEVELSRDHKPEIPEEKKRIEMNGGRVEAYQDDDGQPFGPTRVWVKNQDFPGIAMSRSLGDSVAGSIGVISVPEISERELQPVDKFFVIGSDGLFEFISSEDIVRLAACQLKSKDPALISNYLVRIANERWRKEEESVDDVTCVCVLLNIEA
jgi:serine/threonine protein phosphatase PrpC